MKLRFWRPTLTAEQERLTQLAIKRGADPKRAWRLLTTSENAEDNRRCLLNIERMLALMDELGVPKP